MQQDLSELVASLMDQAAASLAASLLRAKHANPAQADAVLQEAEKTWLLDEIRPELEQAKDEKTLKALLAEEFQKQHQRKKAEAPLQIAQLEKMILLSVIDHQWNDHVDSMNRLREGIYLRSYAQIKPEDAYRQEGFERFTNMMACCTFKSGKNQRQRSNFPKKRNKKSERSFGVLNDDLIKGGSLRTDPIGLLFL